MKKIPSILLIGFLFILSACAAPAGTATPAEPSPTPGVVNTNYQNSLPVAEQLALGTLRLKGTAYDISKEEAASLLFLWQGMLAVSNGTNPSMFEINGVVGQIQEAMQPTQLQAIATMKLTNADIATTAQQFGLTFGGSRGGNGTGNGSSSANGSGATGSNRTGGTGSTGSTNRGSNGGNFGGGGAFFGGGGGGFGGIPGAGTTGSGTGSSSNSSGVAASTQATVQARATQRAAIGNTFVYNMVVMYLESLVPGSAPAAATPVAPNNPPAQANPGGQNNPPAQATPGAPNNPAAPALPTPTPAQ